MLKSLLNKGLIEEVPAADDQNVWRCGEDGKPLTLRAVGEVFRHPVERVAERTEGGSQPEIVGNGVPARTRGIAQKALLGLLRREDGATIAEMQAATGWQPHSVRGALSKVVSKKLGHKVTSTKEDRGRVYRIAD